jgi:hypothetical protein
MANITVQAVPSNTTVNVLDGNNITAAIQSGSEINVQVTPQARQVINLNRGVAGPAGPPGPVGPSGNSNIGGYPVTITGAANYDALMFVSNQWVNVPQAEIADGGNF